MGTLELSGADALDMASSVKWTTGLALLVLGLGACSDQVPVRTVEKVRVHDVAPKPVHWDASSKQRFGVGFGSDHVGHAPKAPFSWRTPSGWREMPATSFRTVNLLVREGEQKTECYLTVLPGEAGGLLENVNRWRQQLGHSAITDAEVRKLPTQKFLEGIATYVDFEGSWNGNSDHRLVGLLQIDAKGSHFLKMVGPKAVVGQEMNAFRALAKSFRIGGTGHGDHSGDSNSGGNNRSRTGAGGSKAKGLRGGTSDRAEGLSWTAPKGWRKGPPRSMRVATYFVGGDRKTECYITVLPGHGGRQLPNINRWRRQMGQRALNPMEFKALTRIRILGGEAPLVEVGGSYRGMGGESVPVAFLLGTVCNLPNRTVFVKMIGPKKTVISARQDFIAFCRSLKQNR